MASNGVTCAFSVLVLAAAAALLDATSASRIVNGPTSAYPLS